MSTKTKQNHFLVLTFSLLIFDSSSVQFPEPSLHLHLPQEVEDWQVKLKFPPSLKDMKYDYYMNDSGCIIKGNLRSKFSW